jgi:hypothetical protein
VQSNILWVLENSPAHWFIRLCQNTLQLAAGMNGGPNRVEARQGEDGLASAQFRFDTPQLAAGSFI